jgi:hypothetical protein
MTKVNICAAILRLSFAKTLERKKPGRGVMAFCLSPEEVPGIFEW